MIASGAAGVAGSCHCERGQEHKHPYRTRIKEISDEGILGKFVSASGIFGMAGAKAMTVRRDHDE